MILRAGKTGSRKAGTAFTRQRAVAGAVAVMLALAQLLAVSHFILVPHSLSLKTGKVVHCCNEASSHKLPGSGDHERHREVPDDECQVFAVMHQAAILSVCDPSIVPEVVEFDGVPVPWAEDLLVSQRVLWLLAPSRSPPVSRA